MSGGCFILCDCHDFEFSNLMRYQDKGVEEYGEDLTDPNYQTRLFEREGVKIILGSPDELKKVSCGYHC